ncbi:MAG TPA: serine hydrolase domain-containing protein, partial [Lacipirellulaceae bacterium]|nr:serine hydrolase domain-containing protein [Lacipirellulaceae bacterium]
MTNSRLVVLEMNRMSRCIVCRSLVASIAFAFVLSTIAGADGDRFAPIKARLQSFIDEGQISGVVAAFDDGDTEHTIALGLANREKHSEMSADTLFGVMSMTKPITATALMILVDEGKLSLDDPVAKYIPAFADAKTEGGEPVRGLAVRHVLTHTSGLTGEQGCRVSLEATANELAARPFEFQPGEKWEYGPSLNVAGRIIEVVSGQAYDQFLKRRIFAPLGMNESTFHPTDEQRERVAVLYELSEDRKSLVPAERILGIGQPDCVPNPSGGLFSTAGDMLAFYRMILGGGESPGKRILSADAVREMSRVQTGDLATGFTPGNAWGLGWCIVRKPQGVSGMLSPG